jgi:hypothetical protein
MATTVVRDALPITAADARQGPPVHHRNSSRLSQKSVQVLHGFHVQAIRASRPDPLTHEQGDRAGCDLMTVGVCPPSVCELLVEPTHVQWIRGEMLPGDEP